ncbi:hypothetical protein K437DRAFT_260751 [Tilletiaria anomala UBC 951]|uniref:Uncharacterized protein n=1 Tax=Tilletiaria anomala (strain ATCC 24038 / CBS 436.72 / UBC 951) TaxID=1037660 RepID=A0A066WH04_TILAU|nr:uncharacterized protein K437DRAFT_260751 [Tilletiaria anomala UBC 951]KDN53272.1 hypothetical protein K437DRAFT_260751 [Tilletiaria anomala UBC 951]
MDIRLARDAVAAVKRLFPSVNSVGSMGSESRPIGRDARHSTRDHTGYVHPSRRSVGRGQCPAAALNTQSRNPLVHCLYWARPAEVRWHNQGHSGGHKVVASGIRYRWVASLRVSQPEERSIANRKGSSGGVETSLNGMNEWSQMKDVRWIGMIPCLTYSR